MHLAKKQPNHLGLSMQFFLKHHRKPCALKASTDDRQPNGSPLILLFSETKGNPLTPNGCFQKIEVPQKGWFLMETLFNGWFGCTTISGNTQIRISDVLCEIHQDVWAEEELGCSRLFKSHYKRSEENFQVIFCDLVISNLSSVPSLAACFSKGFKECIKGH